MALRQWLTLCAYVAIVAVTFGTSLVDAVEWWLLLLVMANVGLGAGVARWWALAVPAVVAVALVAVDWLWALVQGVPAVGLTAVGVLLGRASPRVSVPALVLCGAACALALGLSAYESVRRGPPLPASVQEQLPLKISLGNLCPGAESDPEVTRDVRARGERLVRELRTRPRHTVTYTQYWAHGGEELQEITVRRLAENQLGDLEGGGVSGEDCAPDLMRRLRAAL
jgi:hypothetical protein